MKHIKLGGLDVARIGLGTMGMTGTYGADDLDDAESIRTIHRAIDLGVTLIDTAEIYGPFTNEELVGRALKGKRDQVVLATKFGFVSHAGEGPWHIDSSPANVRAAVEGSLKRLDTDHIDPPGAPQPFLPEPQHLLRPGSTLPCTGPGAYPASWISGVAREPTADAASHLLISYDSYCVTGNPDALTAEGFGLIEYDPARNLLSWPAAVFSSVPGLQLPPQQVLGSPVFPGDGYLYLFSFCPAAPPPAGCGHGKVFAVRTVAQPAYWQNPFDIPVLDRQRVVTGRGRRAVADARQASLRDIRRGLQRRRPRPGHDRADQPGRRLRGVAGQVAGRPVAADHHRPGAVRRRLPARNAEPVPGRHRPSGTQYPRPAAHFLFRSGRSSRGGVRLSLVIPHPQEHPRLRSTTHSRPAS